MAGKKPGTPGKKAGQPRTPTKPNDEKDPILPGPQPTGKTHYEERQQNEVMVLKSIYGVDFIKHEAAHSAWKKSEPSFDIRIKTSSDEDVAVTLGVVLTATYPKSPPLLTIRSHGDLRESTLFKVQKFVETKPKVFATEEEEMVDRIVEGIREILEEAAEAKAKGLEVPSLEEERAAHEVAQVKAAEGQKEEEERKRLEESKEEERVLGDMLQEEMKRRQAKAKETRKKNRSNNDLADVVTEDTLDSEDGLIFDQTCKVTDSTGNTVFFKTVNCKFKITSGPITTLYRVYPVLPPGQERSELALKQVEVQAAGKDPAQFKKQLQALENQLESVKKLSHQAVLDVLEYRIDRVVHNEDNSNAMGWNVSVLSPFADERSLEKKLRNWGVLDIDMVRSCMIHLLDALGYLHSHGVVHQDIHPGNILLLTDQTGDILYKLADAGYQRELHNLCMTTRTLTSMRAARPSYWLPQEIASGSKPQYTVKTDIWDLGVVFLQMLFGLDVLQKYQSPSVLMNTLELSNALEELLSMFFKEDPKKRPRPFELSSSEFLVTDAPILDQELSAVPGSNLVPSMPIIRSRHNSTSTRPIGPSTSRYEEDFAEERRLGKGGFGEVVKARRKLDGGIYAIKKIIQRSKEGLTEVLKEVRLLSQLSHPSVVRYYNAWLEEYHDNDADEETGTEVSQDDGTLSARTDIDLATSKGLDFISSSRKHPDFDIEFEDDDDDDEDNDDDEGNDEYEDDDDESGSDEDEESDSDEESATETGHKAMAIRTRRPSTRPFSRRVLYIWMEYCEKRTLRDLISNNLQKDPAEIWRLFRQILEGLVHIHGLNVVHRDLKPENIFIGVGPDNVNNVKIGDFGLASKGQFAEEIEATAVDHEDLTRSIGTAVYVAPEVRSGSSGSYTSKVDMYSLGIMFFEMCYHPMVGMERATVLENLRKPQPQLPLDFSADKTQTEIILSLLTHSPKERPSSAELLKSDKLPDEEGSESVRRTLAKLEDPKSQLSQKILPRMFAKQVEPATDLAWDLQTHIPSASELRRHRIVKQTLASIFRRHGAEEVDGNQNMLYPRSPHYGNNVVELLDKNGTKVQLPYDSRMGFARMLAKTKNPVLEKSFAFGGVFRERPAGAQPNTFGEADFNIVTNSTFNFALKEAETIKVVDEIVAAFPTTSSVQMVFQLGHSDLLQLVFDYCGIESSCRRETAEFLSKLNVRGMAWQKLRGDLRSCGVSATSVDELQRFDFRETPSKVSSKLKTLFEGTDYYQKASSTLAHLKEVHEYCKHLGVKSKFYVTPLHCFNEKFFRGGIMFACVYDRKTKDVFAAGGRYDSLIKEFRPKTGDKYEERHAVGVTLGWERLAQTPAKTGGKAFLKKAAPDEEPLGIHNAKRCDVLVASFDPTILRTTGQEILAMLWENDISAESADDARSAEELISKRPDESHSWMVIVKSDILKIKTLWSKEVPDVEIAGVRDLLTWLRGEIRERDPKAAKFKSSFGGGIPASDTNNSLDSLDMEVRVLTAQTKSKKFNRQTVVEQTQIGASKLVQGFLGGAAVAIETTDQVMDLISKTSLSEAWKLDVSTAERKYIKDVHEILVEFKTEGKRHAFIHNFRTGTMIHYDLLR